MIKKVILSFFIFITLITELEVSNIYAKEVTINEFVSSFDKYSGEIIDVSVSTNNLIKGNELDKKKIIIKIIEIFIKEISSSIKYMYLILIILIITSILNEIKMDVDESVKKIIDLVSILTISIYIVKISLNIIKIFRSSILNLTVMLQTVIPFFISILVFSGKIKTTSIIGPGILFIIQLIEYISKTLVIPFCIFALALIVVSNINTSINLKGVVTFFTKTSTIIITTILGIFIFFLSMETNIGLSIDGVSGKVIGTAANLVPVVGKYINESVDTLIGSLALIKNVAGTITILIIIQIMIYPIIKIISIIVIFNMFLIITQLLLESNKVIIEMFEKFLSLYKFILGIQISISITFIIAIGIIINISFK